MEPEVREQSYPPALRVLSSESARVGDLPLISVPAVPAHLSMAAARKIAALKRAPLLLAERDGVLIGVVDERALLAAADDLEVGQAAKRLDLAVTPSTPVTRALQLLLQTVADALPVSAGAFLLGVVTRAALERAVREPARPPAQSAPSGDLRRPRRQAA